MSFKSVDMANDTNGMDAMLQEHDQNSTNILFKGCQALQDQAKQVCMSVCLSTCPSVRPSMCVRARVCLCSCVVPACLYCIEGYVHLEVISYIFCAS